MIKSLRNTSLTPILILSQGIRISGVNSKIQVFDGIRLIWCLHNITACNRAIMCEIHWPRLFLNGHSGSQLLQASNLPLLTPPSFRMTHSPFGYTIHIWYFSGASPLPKKSLHILVGIHQLPRLYKVVVRSWRQKSESLLCYLFTLSQHQFVHQ